MNHWLFKSEPSSWSWQDQLARGAAGEEWDGVRNSRLSVQPVRPQEWRIICEMAGLTG